MGEGSRPRLLFRSGRKFACWQNGMKTIEPIRSAVIRSGGELFRRRSMEQRDQGSALLRGEGGGSRIAVETETEKQFG